MKSDISFYFVLYLIAVVTVFAITVERDATLEQRNEIIAQMIEVYVRPLHVRPYIDTTKYYIDISQQAMSESVRVKVSTDGPISRNDIEFALVETDKLSSSGTKTSENSGRLYNEQGDGVLVYPPLAEGTYRFRISGHKNRIKTNGKTMNVVIGDTSYEIPYSSRFEKVDRDTTSVFVTVVKSGLEKQQITLSVPEANDHWVLGLPFKKKVFVGGIETMQGVTMNASAGGRIEHQQGEAFYTFVWDQPVQGKHSFTVNANANRGAGGKDQANISFNVDVRPPTFITTPPSKGFWGMPYTFDGQIAGLNPLDVGVEYSHDGQPLGSQPVLPAIVTTPTKGWNQLHYKILYHGTVIKEHDVALAAPPPPQVRWVQQSLDKGRGVYIVQFTCSDAAGGPVTISIQSQPSGISTLDKIRGTSFTVTVNLASKPASVFIKLSVSDQYGGQSTSSKQFNIPQQ